MDNTSSDDELKPRLSTLFYSVAAMVLDVLILYFILTLPSGFLDAQDAIITAISAGLLFPCAAGILVSFFWERKNIFAYSVMLYGLIIFAGSVYSLLYLIDIWGILFAVVGVAVTYLASRELRKSF